MQCTFQRPPRQGHSTNYKVLLLLLMIQTLRYELSLQGVVIFCREVEVGDYAEELLFGRSSNQLEDRSSHTSESASNVALTGSSSI